jgi:hypothetical protein
MTNLSNKLSAKLIAIFCKEFGKAIGGAWLLYALFEVVRNYFGSEFNLLISLLVFVFLSAVGVQRGWEEYKIESRGFQLREYGRMAGTIGRPPEFYKKSENNFDVFDELIVMSGWDEGYKAFQSLPKETQALYYERNRLDGYTVE